LSRGSCRLHVQVGIRGMPRSLAGRILEAAGIAEPPLRGHPGGVPFGRISKAGRGIAVTVASGSSWGSVFGLDIQLDIDQRNAMGALR
jgi:hypothetical protein